MLQNLAERYTAAWCSQDPQRVAACYSPGGSLSINGGAPAIGREAIAQAAQGFMTAFPDLVVRMDRLVFNEYHWTLTGTHDGRKVCISGREMWTIGEDGLIADSQGSFDSDEYLRQLAG